MDIVKKNIVSILCGVVALAAVIVWFFPINSMYEDLDKQVKDRAAVYTQVEALRTAARVKPSLVLEQTEPEQLGRFPNEQVIEAGRKATEAMTGQSKLMLNTVTERNMHDLLVPGSLPKPEGSVRFEFIDVYLTTLGLGPDGWAAGLPSVLKATTPPTEEEITAAAEEVWRTKYAIQVIEIGGKNNLGNLEDQFRAEMKELPDQQREDRALKHMVYLSEDALPVSPAIQPGGSPTDPEIWFAQSVLWIEEDVVKSIVAANAGAKNVTVAPIKHLVAMRVPFGPEQYVMSGGPGAAAAAGGEEAAPAASTDAPAVFTASPTGRVCNDLYDVVHFDLVLRVDARKVPQVLAELERNKLVTVLKTDVAAIDSAAARKEFGYVYGNDPVVELSLQCEALFLRSWTVDKEGGGKRAIMPDEVQQAVGAQAARAAAGSEG